MQSNPYGLRRFNNQRPISTPPLSDQRYQELMSRAAQFFATALADPLEQPTELPTPQRQPIHMATASNTGAETARIEQAQWRAARHQAINEVRDAMREHNITPDMLV